MWGLDYGDSGDDSSGKYPTAVGFASVAVAILFFGSNFVPVKKIESGDGMFFQWVMCSAIWWCGLVVQIVRGSPTFYTLAMLGGFIWATGNILTVPIIKTVGLGQGILIWASFNLLIGWASGRFGWFGVTPQVVSHSVLNYTGVALCLVSTFTFFFIKSESQTRVGEMQVTVRAEDDDDDDPLLPQSVQEERVTVAPPNTTFLDRMSPLQKRIFGCLACVVAGCLYGANFQPIFYIMDNYHDDHGGKVSQNVLDYVFAHFCGIYITSSVYFIIYCAFKRNQPSLYPRIVLPGIISGIMWAVADIGWFIANKTLSEPVAFPMITAGPAIIGALWGVILFKEIRGKRNLLVLLLVAKTLIAEGLAEGTEEKVTDEVEHAHPIGKPDGNKSTLIARLHRRPFRNSVLAKAKKKDFVAGAVRVVEDMTKLDHDRKQRAYPLMEAAHQNGKKTAFRRGKLYIDGKETTIPPRTHENI